MMPLRVESWPLVSNVPPPGAPKPISTEPSSTARVLSKLARNFSVPPPKNTPPPASPRLPLPETASVPTPMVVPPA